jgi:hypothetical protein
VVFSSHTQFQLYHCKFSSEYLIHLRDKGFVSDKKATLNRTKIYDFADIDQRGEWFDLVVALLQYLKSGEAKVGYLNRSHPKNALHRVLCLLDSRDIDVRISKSNYIKKKGIPRVVKRLDWIGRLNRRRVELQPRFCRMWALMTVRSQI